MWQGDRKKMKHLPPHLINIALHQVSLFSFTLQYIYREVKFIFPNDSACSYAKRLFIVLKCLPFLRQASTWLESANNPLLASEFSTTPQIREFLFRPYINRHWNASKRLEVIDEHYRLVSNNAPFLNLAPNEYIDLATFDLVSGKLRIVLDRPGWMRREGEIGLSLFLGIDRIFTVMFLLCGSSDNMKLLVGSVQGTHNDPTHETFKKLAKELHGIRPRDLLLHITKMISEELGCVEILGISDAAHRSKHLLSRAFKCASYDAIWLEHGGEKVGKDFFALESKFVKRSETHITTRKRALYRRRYEFLDDTKLLLKGVVASPPPKKFHQF